MRRGRAPGNDVFGVGAVRTTFAGFVLLAASNMLLILSLGTEPAERLDHNDHTGVTGTSGLQNTRTTTTTTAAAAPAMEGGRVATVV